MFIVVSVAYGAEVTPDPGEPYWKEWIAPQVVVMGIGLIYALGMTKQQMRDFDRRLRGIERKLGIYDPDDD